MILYSIFHTELWDCFLDFLEIENLLKLAGISPYFAEIIIFNKNMRMRIFLSSSNMWEKKCRKQLLWACKNGYPKVCQWLHSTFTLSGEDALAKNNFALRWACKNGHLEVCQWLHSTFNLTGENVQAKNNFALRWACENGHLKVCQWFHSTFNLTGEDAWVRDNLALGWACRNGHLEVCQWLHSTFKIKE